MGTYWEDKVEVYREHALTFRLMATDQTAESQKKAYLALAQECEELVLTIEGWNGELPKSRGVNRVD